MRLAKLDFYTKRINKEGNMKYKVGDKVRVRTDLVIDRTYDGILFRSDMARYEGQVVTISRVGDDFYKIEKDSDSFDWSWSAEMFEDIPENEIKARTVDVGYCLKPYGHRMIGNVYQGVDNGKLFFTTVDGLNQYVIPKDAIDWIIPHPQEV
jgi:hypothetical protein